jgi:hypothetical protein
VYTNKIGFVVKTNELDQIAEGIILQAGSLHIFGIREQSVKAMTTKRSRTEA